MTTLGSVPCYVSHHSEGLCIYRNGLVKDQAGTPLGQVPVPIIKFQKYHNSYYWLDSLNRLWRDNEVWRTNIKDFNEYYYLTQGGWIYDIITGEDLEPLLPVIALAGDLLLCDNHCLFDSNFTEIMSNIVSAHTDGDSIIAINKNGDLEFCGGDSIDYFTLEGILSMRGLTKAKVNNGTVIGLNSNGILFAGGLNLYGEAGCFGSVDDLQEIRFPHPVYDFDFNNGIGWTLLMDMSVWVWGSATGFVSPQPLLL